MNYVKGWKTVGLMSALAVYGVLDQADWVQLVPHQYLGLTLAVVGAVGILLRSVTNTPVGKNS